MKISSYTNNINYINKLCKNRARFTGLVNYELDTDIFERRNNTSNSKSYKEFKKWAEETDFLNKCKDIAERDGRILGSGFEGTVYEIPECDNWVIKEYKRNNFFAIALEKPVIEEINDNLPDINVGQCIAKISIPYGKKYSCQYWILKKQKGNSLGLAHLDERNKENWLTKDNLKMHRNSLLLLANAPQSTYNKLIKDIKYITTEGYKIDCDNSNNFLFDKDEEIINLIDIADKYKNNESTNQYANVLYALLGSEFGLCYKRNYEETEDKKIIEIATKTIINKYITAMKNLNVKFEDTKYLRKVLESRNGKIKEEIENLKKENLCN